VTWQQILTIVGPALAVIGAIVGLTRYVTQLQARLELSAHQQQAKLDAADHARAAAQTERKARSTY
jgi:hypothetical protein